MAVPLPDAFTAEAVAIGTAGLPPCCACCAGEARVKPADGVIVVTGAAGGVGSVAIAV
jgi:acrylyl-CoA reductase (NADPH)